MAMAFSGMFSLNLDMGSFDVNVPRVTRIFVVSSLDVISRVFLKANFFTNLLDFRFRSLSVLNIQNLSNCCSQKGDEEAARASMQKLRGEQTNIEEELLELQEGIEATANKVKTCQK
jgi:uncharacterized protein YlxW (UPF0749 family)